MSTSVPVCDETDGLFGVPWPDILEMRDRIARKYWRTYGERIPLEEFVSAGNLAIALTRRTFPHATSGVSYRQYLGCAIKYRCLEYFHRENKPMRRGTLYGFPLARLPVHVAYDRGHDARRLLTQAHATTTPRNRDMLHAWLAGDTDRQIGQRVGLAQVNASRAIRKVLGTLQTWAWHGASSPPPLTRRVTTLTPQNIQRIQHLARDGVSTKALERRFHVHYTIINRVLTQEETCHERA